MTVSSAEDFTGDARQPERWAEGSDEGSSNRSEVSGHLSNLAGLRLDAQGTTNCFPGLPQFSFNALSVSAEKACQVPCRAHRSDPVKDGTTRQESTAACTRVFTSSESRSYISLRARNRGILYVPTSSLYGTSLMLAFVGSTFAFASFRLL